MKLIILIITFICNDVCYGQIPTERSTEIVKYFPLSDSVISLKEYKDTSDAVNEEHYPGAMIIVNGITYIREIDLSKWVALTDQTTKVLYDSVIIIEVDTSPKVYGHKAWITLTSIPVQYQCGRCGKIYQDIADTTECIPTAKYHGVFPSQENKAAPLKLTKGDFMPYPEDGTIEFYQDTGYITYMGKRIRHDTIKLKPEFEPLFDSIIINGNEQPLYHRKKDTIPTILIVIDKDRGTTFLLSNTAPLGQAKIDNRIPFWIDGYEVRELHNIYDAEIINGTPTFQYPGYDRKNNYWKHLYYLDSDKKQLPKSVIVWQSMSISVE